MFLCTLCLLFVSINLYGVELSQINKEFIDVREDDNGVNKSSNISVFQEDNDTYFIEDEIILDGVRIVLPQNSRIVFNGGVIRGGELVGNNSLVDNLTDNPCLDNVVLSGTWVNKKASSDLFNFDLSGAKDDSVNAKSLFNLSNVIELGEGVFSFSDIKLSNNPLICGIPGRTLIKAVLQFPDISSSNKDVFVVKDCKSAIFFGINFKGDLSKQWYARYKGGTFIDCENVEMVKIDSCNFTESCNYTLDIDNECKGALINCYDCNDITISNCSISKSVKTEHVNIDVKKKSRTECNVTFKNNHIYGFDKYYCGARGNSILTAYCNILKIEGNLIEDFFYTGSIINTYALHSIIINNIIRNCRTTSVFDNCEYAEMWGESFIAESNIVECSNALCFVLQADRIYIKNNRIKSFAGIVAKNNLLDGTKCNSQVFIKNNTWNLTHYSEEESLPPLYWRYGINIESNYGEGGLVEISDNYINIRELGQSKEIRQPIKVLNVPYVYFLNNIIDTNTESPYRTNITGIFECIASTSKTRPMEFKTFEKISLIGNRVLSENQIRLLQILNKTDYDNIYVVSLENHSNKANNLMDSAIEKGNISSLITMDEKCNRIIRHNVDGIF